MSNMEERPGNNSNPREEWPYLLPASMAGLILLALLASVTYGTLSRVDAEPSDDGGAFTLPVDMGAILYSTRLGRGWLAVKVGISFAGVGLLLWALSRALRRKTVFRERAVSPVRWTWWDLGKLVSVYIALGFAGSALAGGAFESPAGALAETVARAVLIVLALNVVVRVRKGSAASLGLRLDNGRYALAAGVLGFVALEPVQATVRVVQKRLMDGLDLELEVQPSVEAFLTAGGVVPATILVMAVVVAPLTEEFVFRGMFQGLARKHFGTTAAIGASAVLFALAHGSIHALPSLVVVGIGAAVVYDRTRSLLAPIVFHVLHNALELTALLALRGPMST